MPAPEIIKILVRQFTENRDAYRKGHYNEAQLRQEFLNPFFEALGWDMFNNKNYAPQNREVIHEDSINIKGDSRAPDYSFRLGQTRKFFVEAKKPSVDIKYDIHPAYQVRRYAWNSKLPLSILTDFEELAVYDCRNKPNPSDSAATARVLFYKYTEYVEKWDEIAAIFSRDAVWKGSFDKFAADKSPKRGTTEVDNAFLEEIEAWRALLARNIALRNPQVVNEQQLNFAVQMTIDRIIFLRICEDRGIEPENQLLDICKSSDIYRQLVMLFERADIKYNSGLFHFKTEKGESNRADNLTPNLVVDDRILKQIIKSIYYPCPYIFNEIPVEILGQVYEQFLGKIIRLTPGHQAKIEEKPEVRKAGGVYYTPKYIVDYIVSNTVGKMLREKTPVEASDLKIVDPACGSGSFLLGAFQFLLDWHEEWYLSHNPDKWVKGKNPALTPVEDGNWKLTTAEKKRILVNNIFGVDIDAQAVEVTKLSLLLKVLEEETGQLSLGLERVLPDLGENIKCGNSLIDWDYFEGQLIRDDDEADRVNPFDWHHAFPQVFKRGGFDAVIGNPPWGADLNSNELSYLKQKNRLIIVRMIDTFMYFVYQMSKKVRYNGYFGMILPDVILYQQDNSKLREFLLKNFSIDSILNLGNVFEKVTRPCCVIVTKNDENRNSIKINNFSNINEIDKSVNIFKIEEYQTIVQNKILEIPNFLFVTSDPINYDIWNKIKNRPNKLLADFVDDDGIQRGVSPDLKDAFVVNSEIAKDYKLETEKLKKVLTGGKHVKRYYIDYVDQLLIYTSNNDDFNNYPNICSYIDSFKKRITCKEVLKKKHSIYSLHRPRKEHIFTKDKKALGVITEDEIIIAIDDTQVFATDGLYLFGVKESVNLYYVIAILNSKLMKFIYRLLSIEEGRALAQVKPAILSLIPIREINESNSSDIFARDSLVSLVESILILQKQVNVDNLIPVERERIERKIRITDRQIDNLVFDLYGLTKEEIRIVEGDQNKSF